MDLDFRYKELLEVIDSFKPFDADIALILGSGLGEFADEVNTVKTIATNALPDYPHSTVQGHKGFIHWAEHKGKRVIIFQGRIHFYEGYKIHETVLPVLIAKRNKSKYLLLTNAAGGINNLFKPADLMLINSINAIAIKKELTNLLGIASLEQKNNMLDFPSDYLMRIIKDAAGKEKIELKEGVYYFSKGPSYETPSEIKMMAKTGSDAVGMSTAHEALFAVANGIQTAGISCITNLAAGISKVKLSHHEVMETAGIVKEKFERLVKRTIELI
ncbi:MAG: purine-nucleoside phosphorylase [Melioribacteraceae bacterium]|nr:purine-nucleoside phosphorylase [Melioribacteraceae bacterium]